MSTSDTWGMHCGSRMTLYKKADMSGAGSPAPMCRLEFIAEWVSSSDRTRTSPLDRSSE